MPLIAFLENRTQQAGYLISLADAASVAHDQIVRTDDGWEVPSVISDAYTELTALAWPHGTSSALSATPYAYVSKGGITKSPVPQPTVVDFTGASIQTAEQAGYPVGSALPLPVTVAGAQILLPDANCIYDFSVVAQGVCDALDFGKQVFMEVAAGFSATAIVKTDTYVRLVASGFVIAYDTPPSVFVALDTSLLAGLIIDLYVGVIITKRP